VDRTAGAVGYCRAGAEPEVFRYGPHHGEEPPVSGTRGSGTIFFSRCTLRCLYCQNYPWSQNGEGERMSVAKLAAAMRSLRDAGCHNWNLVSPTPWLPAIRAALDEVGGRRIPFVYNTSGFERAETIEAFGDLADVFLTDLRYARAESALEGSGEAGYARVAREALLAMWRMRGPLEADDEGVARSGTICRLLVLPGRADEAVENLRWLAQRVGTDIAVSVMSQYWPAHRAGERGAPWNRRVTAEEYASVRSEVESLGFGRGWVQEHEEQPAGDLLGFRMSPGGEAGRDVEDGHR
jgi:putative pyruvate formate lyase activating enzyme